MQALDYIHFESCIYLTIWCRQDQNFSSFMNYILAENCSVLLLLNLMLQPIHLKCWQLKFLQTMDMIQLYF